MQDIFLQIYFIIHKICQTKTELDQTLKAQKLENENDDVKKSNTFCKIWLKCHIFFYLNYFSKFDFR